MITEWDIYWLTRLDGMRLFLGVSMTLSIVAVCVIGLVAFLGPMHARDFGYEPVLASKLRKIICFVWVIPFLISFILIFLPTTKEMCAIKVVPKIANNTDIQGLGNDVVTLARDWMNELKPKSATSAGKGE